jgi:integrase
MIRRLVSPKTGRVTYQVDLYGPDGKRFRATFKLRRDAETIEAQARIAKKTDKWAEIMVPAPKVKFADFLPRYAAAHQHQKDWPGKAKKLPFLLAAFGEKNLDQITYADIELWRQDLLAGLTPHGNRRAPATVNRYHALLRHALNKAVSWGLLQSSPLSRGESLQLPEPRGRLRYLSLEEMASLLAECPVHLEPLVRLALHTGLRKGELLSLRWDQIKGACLYLDGSQTKTSEPRSVPLNEEAQAALDTQRRRRELTSLLVFPYKEVKDAFAGACRRAGIFNFRFHDLRHTFASHLAMAGVSLTTIAMLLGHRTLTMTLRYAHLSPGHLQEAVEKLVKETKNVYLQSVHGNSRKIDR